MKYNGSYQEYDVKASTNVMIPMKDNVSLATDLYFPALDGNIVPEKFPVVLVRTPYDKSAPKAILDAKFLARRGYVCAMQDVRGRFSSEGEWYPFAKEAPDGFDTVEWLGAQKWSDGKVGTMGDSYAGSDQAALATLNPPHLSTMIVSVGASNYYHSSMRQNGALEQRFLVYVFRMAATSQEAESDPSLKSEIMRAYTHYMTDLVNQFPIRQGATILRRLPSYERWAIDIQTRGEYDEYWKQRGYAMSEYYEEHADIPTLYLGGWYDSYARNTCESYVKLSKIKTSNQHLLMGPWTHGEYETTYSGDFYFGTDAQINYMDLKLSWFDAYLKGLNTNVKQWKPVKIFTMGTGQDDRAILGSPGDGSEYPGRIDHGGFWREEEDWPLPDTSFTPFYLHGNGLLSKDLPINDGNSCTKYTFDPCNPVPTIGGGISAADIIIRPGSFDQRGRSDFIGCVDTLPLQSRHDVLTYQTKALENEVELTGPVEMRLWASSSALDTDFTAKLIDVYPPSSNFPDGLAFNITDSIIRARYRNGWEKSELLQQDMAYEFVFQLYPTSNVFRKGHKIRLDVSSSNWPRFDVNPNTGNSLGDDRSYSVATQTIYHEPNRASCVVLPLQSIDPK